MPWRLSSPSLHCHIPTAGRTSWVPRKKMFTILRNRKSAAACRSTIVDLKAELASVQAQLLQMLRGGACVPATKGVAGRPMDLSGDGKPDAYGYDTTGE